MQQSYIFLKINIQAYLFKKNVNIIKYIKIIYLFNFTYMQVYQRYS